MKCEYCLEEVEQRRCDQRFCSLFCKDEFYKRLKRIKNRELKQSNWLTCRFCKLEFEPKRHINEVLCSLKCKTDEYAQQQREKRAAIRAATIRNCDLCKKEFNPKRSMREKYCSPKCRTLINKKIYKMMQSVYEKCNTTKADQSHKVLGYSPNDLLAHLQTFPQWEQLKLGSWHLDHIYPIAAFVRRGIVDPKLICKLSNLQPLVGEENCSKGDDCDEAAFGEWLVANSVEAILL